MSQPPLIELRKYLLNNLGLNFTESRENELYKKMVHAKNDFNFKNTNDFINWILKNNVDPNHVEKLAAFLTIGETYFFREIKALDYLENEYLPELINNRRGKTQSLRIWSAGCSSGEEPYSVAIILKRIIPDIKSWNITILATDINAEFLEKARKGVYSKWSFRRLPESFIKNHFNEVKKNEFQIYPEIQNMVTFSYHNLAKDIFPSINNNTNAVDIILCRNVFIYFSNNGIREATSRMHKCLTNNGILIVSPVETSILISAKFSCDRYKGITIYKKSKKEKKVFDREIPTNIKLPSTKRSSKNVNEKIEKPTKETIKTKDRDISKIPSLRTNEEQIEKSNSAGFSEYKKNFKLFKEGLFEEAEANLSFNLSNNKEICESNILLLARIKANLGKLEEAEQLCKKSISSYKLDPVAHYLLATIQSEQGKEEDAIISLNKTLFLNPDFTLAHYLLGSYSVKYGKIKESKKYFDNALNILSNYKPDDVLTESDGLTVGRLTEIIKTIKG